MISVARSSIRLSLVRVLSTKASVSSPQIESPSVSSLTKTKVITSAYLSLGKAKLSSLVVASTLAGYGVATASVPFSAATLGFLATGTFLGAACAGGLNQYMEISNDSRMRRTQLRPLVCGTISPRNALIASAAAGVAGVGLLAVTVNPLTAGLCAANIALYAGIYTPLKQKHYWNTWVGAIVGAIPPVMGWTAATGNITAGSLVMAALLFSWQMPHFLALAYMYRDDYVRGGYQMLSSVNVKQTADVMLRHALYLIPITTLAPILGITDWMFAGEAAVVSSAFALLAYRFRSRTNAKGARQVFFFSLLYLPLILGLMVFHRTSPVPVAFVCPHEAVQVESLAKKEEKEEKTEEKRE